jgi:hypothetical protein
MGVRSGAGPRRRARLAVLSTAAALALVYLLLGLRLDSRWDGARDRRLGAEFRRKSTALHHYAKATGGDPAVLAFGSSRTSMAFRAELFEGERLPDGRPLRGFNFGLFGAGPIASSLAAQRVLDRGVRAEVVLFELYPPALDAPGPGRLGEEGQSWLPAHARAAELPRLCRYHSRPARAVGEWLKSRALLPLGANSPLRQWVAPGWEGAAEPPPQVYWPMGRCGWVRAPLAAPPPHLREEATRAGLDALRRRWPEAFRDYRVGEGARRAVRDAIDCCRARGARVVLLVPPAQAQYRRSFETARACDGRSMDAAFGEFVGGLGAECGCDVIDARDWVADDGFFDGYHLTPEGAGRFTLRLRGELLGLLARK